MNKVPSLVAACATLTLAMSPLVVTSAAATDTGNAGTASAQGSDGYGGHHGRHGHSGRLPGGYKHLVVIYQENHSFDNLYGRWGPVDGHRVIDLSRATVDHTVQVARDGTPYTCLLQVDVNLTSPTPLPTRCLDDHEVNVGPPPAVVGFQSHFINLPFSVDDFISPDDTTCPPPGEGQPNGTLKGTGEPGGCTRDLVHRFYQEQYQLNGGRQNRYVTGSDAVGLAMGVYDTKALPIYEYLHSTGAPNYVIADRFFQAAFGGSFLNHQWLIAARSPLDTSHGVLGARTSVLDDNGMVTTYPLYTSTLPPGVAVDGALTQKCPGGPTLSDDVRACGDFAVNTVQPFNEPRSHPANGKPPVMIPPIDDEEFPNIGDRMTAAGVSWNWYAGGWDAVNTDPTTAPLFQFHHQPFNYFADYAPGTPGRAHLQDEEDFRAAARAGTLPTVSFVKPYGAENEHPGYASEPDGSDHLVDLLRDVTEGPQADRTLVVVTYDEFGGEWDHVSPPGLGNRGVHDAWGPGTRIPALVISRSFEASGVDHTSYDTTSILATIERSFDLKPLSSRDRDVHDLSNAVKAGHGDDDEDDD